MKASAKELISAFHIKRCGHIHISNVQQYESFLYKTLVMSLIVFDGNNWGDFEFTDWISAIRLYEFNNSMPSKYSELREQLESKHNGFYIESEDFGDWLEYDKDGKPLEQEVDPKYDLISSEDDYLYHLHKSIDVMFQGSPEDKQHYNHAKWWKAVGIFEQKHQKTSRSTQYYADERFRQMRKIRNDF